MKVECSNCQRSFELDESRLRSDHLQSLQCVCGDRLDFGPEAASQKPRLGKYMLINRIATGGMGEIFYGKVSGVEGFEKEVAIKRMLPHLSSDRDFVNMMVKEAKLTVLLNHPNIVGIYDLARQGDEYYIAMEYVPGVTVGAILEATRKLGTMLPMEVPVHIIMQVLRGLNYAHNLPTPSGEKLTILHRDITPQNILVTQHGYVKITDFGIAKAVNEISTTSAGMIKGKLGYIAPEQLEGREPDNRIDLFCAGILLWEMFMARRLFKGTSEIDTFRLISECHVPTFAATRNDVPAAVEAVVARALARNPDERYAQADEFNAALAQAIQPRTADDFARATAAFFQAHPDFFTAIVAHKGDASTVPARSSDAAAPPVPTDQLPLVTHYVFVQNAQPTPPPVAKSKNYGWMAAGFVALLGLAGLAYNQLAQAPPPSAQSMSSNAPLGAPVPARVEPQVDPTVPPAAAAVPTVVEAPGTPEAAQDDKMLAKPRREPLAKPLTGPEIQATVQRSQPDIARCLAGIDTSKAPSRVDASITIDLTGKVSEVQITPPIGQLDADRCLAKSMKNMRFHRHPPPEMKVTIPLKIQTF